ncbi:FAD-dependent oxidoreductase [Silvanigrella aquatica]|uniref:D-amino-acid oxidase n=1 Tax=Silvanigrella aquatica TaxID=1915309 RepID=A0A1L4D1B3_9BACT|nr:FAD-dependent oxidoreductase [Silvanigrella aquatica]APJ03992.1 hypothetical protein AXG55_08765 [Silvanigrella aquatica]
MNIAIMGAGVLGRLLAIELHERKHKVTIFEKNDEYSSLSCSATAAGMLAPWSEAQESSEIVFELGVSSLKLWPHILKKINAENIIDRWGTAHLATLGEKHKLIHFLECLKSKGIHPEVIEINQKNNKRFVGNFYSPYSFGYYFPDEASLKPRYFIEKSNQFFKEKSINFYFNQKIIESEQNKIKTEENTFYFDLICNTTGMAAKSIFAETTQLLRGVRGSLILMYAPLVHLNSVIRIRHSRNPIYIVPRGHHQYIIGATTHETECLKPITAEAFLELLNVAVHFDKGFLEAHIMEQRINLRPTLTSGSPQFLKKDEIYYINGLYRNGITISPALVNIFCNYIENKNTLINNKKFEDLWIN